MIITSVGLDQCRGDLAFLESSNSLTASEVMMEVMCCLPIDNVTCASKPLIRMSVTRPIN